MNQPLGFQCYEIFPDLITDWEGTWKKMAGFGYDFVDLVQFLGPLAVRTPAEARQALDANGLYCTNCHFPLESLTGGLAETMKTAHLLGLKSVVTFPSPRKQTVEDWKWMADQLNTIGRNVQSDGLFAGYHNHEIEFQAVDGQLPFDILMAYTDPALVRFQIDVGNLTYAGQNAVSLLEKYPNRYFSLHAKDFAPGKASVPVGQGILDWKKIFTLAKDFGIDNFVAEVSEYNANPLEPDQTLEPSHLGIIESFGQSYTFLHKLTMTI